MGSCQGVCSDQICQPPKSSGGSIRQSCQPPPPKLSESVPDRRYQVKICWGIYLHLYIFFTETGIISAPMREPRGDSVRVWIEWPPSLCRRLYECLAKLSRALVYLSEVGTAFASQILKEGPGGGLAGKVS